MLAVLLVATIAAWLAYEMWLLFTGKPTISEQTWRTLKAYPPIGALIGFATGLLFGHLLWPSSCIFR